MNIPSWSASNLNYVSQLTDIHIMTFFLLDTMSVRFRNMSLAMLVLVWNIGFFF